MIDLYTWPTPNGHKIHILLEECGLPYTVHPVDIGAGEQFDADFLALSPNNKIPVIVDQDGPDGKPITVFESGAILVYLAARTGKFLPAAVREKYDVLQWLMFQMGSIGPMLGQAHHFRQYAPRRIAYAVDRYSNEARRLYGVLERRLGQGDWLAAGEYTIADMATWPWIRSHQSQGITLDEFPQVQRWYDRIAARTPVQRALAVLAERRASRLDERAREVLFGVTQYERR